MDAAYLDKVEELAESLQITRPRRHRHMGGQWLTGSIGGHRFEALVFPEHAECESYELGRSRISKLWLQHQADRREVANFDRGWDRRPATAEAEMIVEFLCEGLAEAAYG